MFMPNIPPEIVEFITKWSTATNQRPEVASKRFWDLMINSEISEEGKDETLTKWANEAGYDFRTKEP